MRLRSPQFTFTVGALCFSASCAQDAEVRFALAQRLNQMEVAWDKAEPAAKKRSVEPLDRAVRGFLRGQFFTAGRELDRARFALLAEQKPVPAVLWASSLTCDLQARLIDATTTSFEAQIRVFYEALVPRPEGDLLVRFDLEPNDEGIAYTLHEGPLAPSLPQRFSLTLDNVVPGDYQCVAKVMLDDRVLAEHRQVLSVVADLPDRMQLLFREFETEPADESLHLEWHSARGLLVILEGLMHGDDFETNYPAHLLLEEAESLSRTLQNSKKYYVDGQPGRYRLRIPVGPRPQAVRISVPTKESKGASPVVVFLHGAGGSENMAFDGYGNGAAVTLSEQRGWYFVATRSVGVGMGPPVIDILQALRDRYSFDMQKVFLIGHSMGAMQGLALVSRDPGAFAGIAALGGGGAIKVSEPLRKVGFYIGIGSKDFLRNQADRLHQQLKNADILQVQYRLYPDIEHLMIVPEALPDVFEFLAKLGNS